MAGRHEEKRKQIQVEGDQIGVDDQRAAGPMKLRLMRQIQMAQKEQSEQIQMAQKEQFQQIQMAQKEQSKQIPMVQKEQSEQIQMAQKEQSERSTSRSSSRSSSKEESASSTRVKSTVTEDTSKLNEFKVQQEEVLGLDKWDNPSNRNFKKVTVAEESRCLENQKPQQLPKTDDIKCLTAETQPISKPALPALSRATKSRSKSRTRRQENYDDYKKHFAKIEHRRTSKSKSRGASPKRTSETQSDLDDGTRAVKATEEVAASKRVVFEAPARLKGHDSQGSNASSECTSVPMPPRPYVEGAVTPSKNRCHVPQALLGSADYNCSSDRFPESGKTDENAQMPVGEKTMYSGVGERKVTVEQTTGNPTKSGCCSKTENWIYSGICTRAKTQPKNHSASADPIKVKEMTVLRSSRQDRGPNRRADHKSDDLTVTDTFPQAVKWGIVICGAILLVMLARR
ncbi:hypothetical protein BV898_13684 [Hypsibius exemplaris]|uniref:Uncharacterized protein n=1 Tax=Hypsibius exemplaris TaxID=2072580 RepID=A0A1W0W9Z4_HYPEX|nr:hypothetical protein BV898_13684 [Hypsibius exemplaris]